MDHKRVDILAYWLLTFVYSLFYNSHFKNTFINHILGTRFRPLSLDLPKPLFPIAGRSIIQHHIEACIRIKELKEILVIGYYPTAQMERFITEMQKTYEVSIR